MVRRCVPRRSAGRSIAVALALLSAVSACTASTTTAKKPASSPTASTRSSSCKPASTGAVHAVPVPDAASDRVIDSFDATKIRIHWFPVGRAVTPPAPTILMGPGWGSGGDTNTSSAGLQYLVSIKDLRDAGYNVLTWDPRGFGASDGTIEVDSARAEARDVQRIIDWVAAQPGVELDSPRDPRMGMIGASYGGGIQLVTAAIDCRVDAIVPSWAWHSLTTSLYKAATVKIGWSTLLYAAALTRKLDPHIPSAYRTGSATGVLAADDVAWFAQRGPGDLVNKVRVPTLFLQGTVDTLFTLDEAVANYRILRSHGVPTAMVWFCGGHGVCLTEPGDRRRVARKTLAWLDRYVKRATSAVPIGPRLELVDQNGTTYTGDDYPLPSGTAITADGRGTLQLTAVGRSGPARPTEKTEFLANIVAPITPAKAANAVDIDVGVDDRAGRTGASVVVGAPQLRLSYRGRVKAGERPTRIFAQLVDPVTGLVVGNQITPIDVTLDGAEHTTSIALETVVFTLEPGARLLLQLVASTVAYAQPRLGGSIDIRAHLALPVAKGLSVAAK